MQEPIADNSTYGGRRELRRENKIHHASVKLAKKNERESRKKRKIGTQNNHKKMAKNLSKERKVARKAGIKTEKKTEKNKEKEERKRVKEEAKVKGN